MDLYCKCGKLFSEEEFINHYTACQDFRLSFKEFDQTLGELLKKFAAEQNNMKIVRLLIIQYLKILDKRLNIPQKESHEYIVSQLYGKTFLENMIKSNIGNNNVNINNQNQNFDSNFAMENNFSNNNNNNLIKNNYENNNFNNNNNLGNQNKINNDFSNQSYYNYNSNNNNKNHNNNNFNNNFDIKKNDFYIDENLETCQDCLDPDIIPLECFHSICLSCFKKRVDNDIYNISCKKCKEKVSEIYIKQIIGQEEYSKRESNLIHSSIVGKLINCPSCKEKINFETGNVNYNEKDSNGVKMDRKFCEQYASQRCRCPSNNCKNNKVDFCILCNASPYHIGKTCEEQQKYKESKKCIYCDQTIINGYNDFVCKNKECTDRFKLSCKKTLKCGHRCLGVEDECVCLDCIHPDCKFYNDKYNQKAEDLCSICYTEELQSSPLVKSSCGHYHHYQCVENLNNSKCVGPKITFGYLNCTTCSQLQSFPNNARLSLLVNKNIQLFEDIKTKVIERLKFEGLDKDKRLSDPNDTFYQKPLEFALKTVAYYMCFKCQKPYFAGLRDCRGGDNDREHKKEELICGGCGALDGVAGVSECKKHGKEFITYKCRFCCSPASWFCWGTTHFCEPCHARQCKGDYVSKYEKSKLPQCNDHNTCPLKIKHPPNGDEYALGCDICKNEASNMKDY